MVVGLVWQSKAYLGGGQGLQNNHGVTLSLSLSLSLPRLLLSSAAITRAKLSDEPLGFSLWMRWLTCDSSLIPGRETKQKQVTWPAPLLPSFSFRHPNAFSILSLCLAQGREKFLAIMAFCLLPGAFIVLHFFFLTKIAFVWLSLSNIYLLCFTNVKYINVCICIKPNLCIKSQGMYTRYFKELFIMGKRSVL